MDRLTFLLIVEQTPQATVMFGRDNHKTYYHAVCLSRLTSGAVLPYVSGPIPLDTVPLDRMCPKCCRYHHGRPDTHPTG